MRRNLATLLLLAAAACTGWRTENAPTPAATSNAANKAPTVRFTLNDGRILDLARPEVIGDSVVGYTNAGEPDPARAAVAVKDVRSVATHRFDGGKTAGLVVVLVLSLFVLMMAGWASSAL